MAGLEKIVTDELVFEVADRLAAEGRKVSNRLIWDQVGGGSMTTIAATLRRWRERQQLKTNQVSDRVPLPEPIAATMRDAVDRLWKAAQDETQKEIDRLTQAMNERVAEATAERDGALAELQATVEELQTAQAMRTGLEAEATAAKQQTETLRTELASIAMQADTATARAVEIERRADDLSVELGRVHEEAKAERQRHEDAMMQIGGQRDAAQAELAAAQATARMEQQQNAELARNAAESAARLKLAKSERDSARQEATDTRESAARLQGKIDAMTAQQAELMRALAATGGNKAEASKAPRKKSE